MAHVYLQSPQEAGGLIEDLGRAKRIALDCEAAGFHRYSDRLCLVQLSTERTTYLIDPLAFDPADVLRGPLEDPDLPVVMHGADFDLRLLARDLRIRLRGLFDTQIAAQLLGEEALGLASLLESRFGVKLSKKFQRADWAERPLGEGMLEYAADDTRHLMRLADWLTAELAEARRLAWTKEECRALEAAAGGLPKEETPEDPVARIKGARHLSPRQLTALREALAWRDEIARAKDRATFRVVAEGPLIEAVAAHPRSVRELLAIKGFPPRLAEEAGASLVERIERVAQMRDDELRGYPRPERRGGTRITPDVEALAERLKDARNRKADELGLPRGTLLSNATLIEIARAGPRSLDALATVDGMRRWKAEALGEDFLKLIR
ncbi:MAG: ribonuclease D [Gemmatimonadetes bacterium]|nr:ribonuclease D [Gemmatimonadota bacterium]